MAATITSEQPTHVRIDYEARRRGFTIAELLIAIAIIAILLALLVLPMSRRGSGTAARRAQCTNNLKQIGVALYLYHDAHGSFPPAYTTDALGRPLHSWRTLILPYLEQETLYKTIDLSKPWNDPVNAAALETAIYSYRCPESRGPKNTTTYLASAGANCCLLPNAFRKFEEITDNPNWTLMVIEAGESNAVPWMAPTDADATLIVGLGPKTKFHHPGGTNACFAAGNVHFLKATTSPEVRRAIASIAGGESVELND